MAVCVPVECTDINTAARASSTSAVSYGQLGKGHLCLGIVVLDGSCLLPWLEVQLCIVEALYKSKMAAKSFILQYASRFEVCLLYFFVCRSRRLGLMP